MRCVVPCAETGPALEPALHTGALPAELTDLTSAVTNSMGEPGGPFMASVPAGPAGWGTYVYGPVATAGTFTVSNSDDSTSVSVQ